MLAGTSYPYELILIDDGSGDQTAHYFATISDKVFRFTKRKGVSKVRNVGFENAEGNLIVFLDNDAFVPRGWLSILAEESLKHRVGIIAGIPSNESDRLRRRPSADGLLDFAVVAGACMAVTRPCFDAVGYFDETMINAGEDYDYCYRAHLAGFRVANTARLIVEHRVGGTRNDLDKEQMIRAGRRFQRKWIKHREFISRLPPYPFP